MTTNLEQQRESFVTYDFSSLNQLFNEFATPLELQNELVQLLFNYASMVEDEYLQRFKEDVGTIEILYNGLGEIKYNNN